VNFFLVPIPASCVRYTGAHAQCSVARLSSYATLHQPRLGGGMQGHALTTALKSATALNSALKSSRRSIRSSASPESAVQSTCTIIYYVNVGYYARL
jgi:hypothetical protein